MHWLFCFLFVSCYCWVICQAEDQLACKKSSFNERKFLFVSCCEHAGSWAVPAGACIRHFWSNDGIHWNILLHATPFPSSRHHRSNGDCLEGKTENYQVCSVQYCVQQLYTVNCTHLWTELAVLWIGFCLTRPISLCLDLFLCMYYFVSDCILHACVVL